MWSGRTGWARGQENAKQFTLGYLPSYSKIWRGRLGIRGNQDGCYIAAVASSVPSTLSSTFAFRRERRDPPHLPAPSSSAESRATRFWRYFFLRPPHPLLACQLHFPSHPHEERLAAKLLRSQLNTRSLAVAVQGVPCRKSPEEGA